MKKITTLILVLFAAFQAIAQQFTVDTLTWFDLTGSNVQRYMDGGAGIYPGIQRNGSGTDNPWTITSTNAQFQLGDTLIFMRNAAGAFNMCFLSSVRPSTTDQRAHNEGNPNAKYGLYHGSGTPNFLTTIENGTAGSTTDIGSYVWFRIIYSTGSIIYQKSTDGTTWVAHATSVAAPSGVYYISVQLQNAGTFSAWRTIYIKRPLIQSNNRPLRWRNAA